eukprot:454911-Amphidinium_carterae.1
MHFNVKVLAAGLVFNASLKPEATRDEIMQALEAYPNNILYNDEYRASCQNGFNIFFDFLSRKIKGYRSYYTAYARQQEWELPETVYPLETDFSKASRNGFLDALAKDSNGDDIPDSVGRQRSLSRGGPRKAMAKAKGHGKGKGKNVQDSPNVEDGNSVEQQNFTESTKGRKVLRSLSTTDVVVKRQEAAPCWS